MTIDSKCNRFNSRSSHNITVSELEGARLAWLSAKTREREADKELWETARLYDKLRDIASVKVVQAHKKMITKGIK